VCSISSLKDFFINNKKETLLLIITLITGEILLEIISPFFLENSNFCSNVNDTFFPLLESKDIIKSNIPNLFYEPKPNSITFNSLGLHDKEYNPIKANNTYRIIVVGDSITENIGGYVADELLFHEILEKMLNEDSKNMKYEVWNAGVRSYNSLQEYLYFQNRLLKFKPDLVIIAHLESNDFDPPYMMMNLIENETVSNKCFLVTTPNIFSFPETVHHFLLIRSSFYRLINLKTYNILGNFFPNKYPDVYFKHKEYIKLIELNKKAILDFIELSKKENFELVIVVFPMLRDDILHDKWIRKIPVMRFNTSVIDILPLLKLENTLESYRISADDVLHPNEKVHKIVAEEIYKVLKKN